MAKPLNRNTALPIEQKKDHWEIITPEKKKPVPQLKPIDFYHKRFPGMRNRLPEIYRKNRQEKRRRKRMKVARDRDDVPLTFREKQFLYYIRMFQWKYRYSPGTSDLSFVFGVTRHSAYLYIKFLIKKGYLEMMPSSSRNSSIRVLFPKNFQNWDWSDFDQFPPSVFPQSYEIYKNMKVAASKRIFTHEHLTPDITCLYNPKFDSLSSPPQPLPQ